MKNKVGRDIPDSMFKTVLKGAEVFQGVNYRDGYVYKKASQLFPAIVHIGNQKWRVH